MKRLHVLLAVLMWAPMAFAQDVVPVDGWLEQAFASLLIGFASLPAPVQVLVVVVSLAATLIPHIAPFTPWTWDDRTIRYKGPLTRLFLKLWNVAAGNWGHATNKPRDW